MSLHPLPRRFAGVLATVALGVIGLVAVPTAASADPSPTGPGADATVTADPLPTVQIDGVAWAQVVVGDTVYVAGEFTTARPAGAAPGIDTTPRSNLLAYDLRTGDLISSWAPTVDGPAYAIAASPDGKRIYVGGDFTHVNGASRNRFTALSATTGALSATFTAGANAAVRAIQATATEVYIGGNFTVVGGQDRPRVASFDATTGAVRNWRASVQPAQVDTILLSPDGSTLYVGGRFQKVNNIQRLGSAALATSNAALLPWTLGPAVFAYGYSAGFESLSTDGTNVYASGFGFLTANDGSDANLEGIVAADPTTAQVRWLEDCHGDTYSVFANPGENDIYLAGHPHTCANIGGFPEVDPRVSHYGFAFTKQAVGVVQPNQEGGYYDMEGYPSPEVRGWWPAFVPGTFTGMNQAGFSVIGTSDYVLYGGEFTSVSGVAQQGLVRFTTRANGAPGAYGPVLSGAALQPVVQSHAPGTMQVSWPANWDTDDETLTYNVYRDNGTTPVYTVKAASRFWDVPRLSFTDSGLSPLHSYSYKVQAVDEDGNAVTSPSASASTVLTGNLGTYSKTVLADNPESYWRLGETSGQFQDWTSWSGATVGNGVTRNQPGAITGDSNRAASFAGTSTSRVTSTKQEAGTSRLTVEAWFRTTSTSGGKIVGFGSASGTSDSSNYDRQIYMTPDGRLVFGVYPNTVRAIESTASYNDGAWHYVAGTLGEAGMNLYVDGSPVASDPGVTFGQSYSGYWHIGGDNLGGWPDAGSSNFVGQIDEVAIYDRELDALTIFRHDGVGVTGQVPNSPPTASFTTTVGAQQATVDGTASSDADGTVVDWSWNWGDGSAPDSGVTASHAYAPGTYTVTLTVTDDAGAQATSQQAVTITPPNQPPTPAFVSSVLRSSVTFDASTSTDADGQIVGLAWDFGDGTTGTGAQASHTYATPGTYTVTLTATDDQGATATVTHDVTVAAPLALDAFGRTTTGGLGTADVGGAWTGAANLAADGSTAVFTAPTAGSSATARLQAVSGAALSTAVVAIPDKRPTGSNAWLLVRGRIVDGQGEYRVKINLTPSGAVSARLVRASSTGTETLLAGDTTVSGLTYTAGTRLGVRIDVVGTSPTTVRARIWNAASAEPTAWLLTATDSTVGLQVPGNVGLALITSTAMTNAPYVVRFDDLRVDAAS